jgi:transcriptional regulator with XRE-family HTH domain
MGKVRSTAANRLIGMRIRERRIKRGLTQKQFAKLIGVNFWQAHKYERGINSVSAGRLYVIAHELSTPLEYFFEGLEPDGRQPSPHQRKLLEAMRDFGEVRNEEYLGAISELTRALAGR